MVTPDFSWLSPDVFPVQSEKNKPHRLIPAANVRIGPNFLLIVVLANIKLKIEQHVTHMIGCLAVSQILLENCLFLILLVHFDCEEICTVSAQL